MSRVRSESVPSVHEYDSDYVPSDYESEGGEDDVGVSHRPITRSMTSRTHRRAHTDLTSLIRSALSSGPAGGVRNAVSSNRSSNSSVAGAGERRVTRSMSNMSNMSNRLSK